MTFFPLAFDALFWWMFRVGSSLKCELDMSQYLELYLDLEIGRDPRYPQRSSGSNSNAMDRLANC